MMTPSYSLTATQKVAPRLALDFTTASLDPRITFTRSLNTATRVNSTGYVESINADLPRFDYNPVTLACKGLLIEEQRANLLTYSQEFDNAAWGKSGATVTANQIVAPDGNTTGDYLNSTAAFQFIRQSLGTTTANAAYALSIYVKPVSGSVSITLGLGDATSSNLVRTTFTLSGAGSFGNPTISGTAAAVLRNIEVAGNGWYRCTLVGTANTTALWAYLQITSSTSSVFGIWGAQVEAGSFPTSYIPTTTTALTRNADVAVMTGANFSDWYNASQGMFRVDASTPAFGTRSLISADDNTSGNSIVMSTVGTAPSLVVTQSSAEQANVSAGTITANTAMFAYASYASNYFGIARPSARQVDTSGAVPTVDRLRIGTDQAGNYANGIIQAIQFWP